MGRILAIDYGKKRTGIAVSDPLKLIATPLCVLETNNVLCFIIDYCDKEQVDTVVVGLPKNLNNKATDSTAITKKFIKILSSKITPISVVSEDERFTSKIAFQSMIDGGVKKMERRKKNIIDKVSATIILQSYLVNITN